MSERIRVRAMSWSLGMVVVTVALAGGCAPEKQVPTEQFESARVELREAMARRDARQLIAEGWTSRDWQHYAKWDGSTFLAGRGTDEPRPIDLGSADYVRIDRVSGTWYYRVVVAFPSPREDPLWLRADDLAQARELVRALSVMGADITNSGVEE